MPISPYEALYYRALLPDSERRTLLRDRTVAGSLRAFGPEVQVTRAVPVASLEARNEAARWHGCYSRSWFQRHHLFGASEGGDDAAGERPFLGFLHLRDGDTVAALKAQDNGRTVPLVAECYTRLPPGLARAGFRAIAGPYTSYHGVLPLDVTPMVFPHWLFMGFCGHSAAHTALLLMSRRGARPFGLFELGLVFNSVAEQENVRVTVSELSLDQIAAGLCQPQTRITAREELYLTDDYPTPQDTHRLLMDTCASGLPVIAAVDFREWANAAKRHQPVTQAPGASTGALGHAVVLVGFKETCDPDKASLLFHDSNLGPWIRMSLSGFLGASQARIRLTKPSGACHVVVPLPLGVQVTPGAVTRMCRMRLASLMGAPSYLSVPSAHLRRHLMSQADLLGYLAARVAPTAWRQLRSDLLRFHPDLRHIWHIVHRPDDPAVAGTELLVDATSSRTIGEVRDRTLILEGAAGSHHRLAY